MANPRPATRGRPFPKGVSGNAGGVSKAVREIREICREKGPMIIERLTEIAETGSTEHALVAMKELLNRGYGRAENYSTIKLDTNSTLTDAEIEQKIKELEAKLGG